MAYSVIVEDAERIARVTLAAAVVQGDILGYNSGWVKADADARYHAEWIALEGGSVGDRIQVAKKAVLYDEDAPYTAAAALYLSATAGALTHTRVTTAGAIRQVCGWAIDTKRAYVEIKAPEEFELFLSPDVLDTTGEPGIGTVDAGWPGPQVDAAAETVYFKGRLPEGLVGAIIEAKVLLDSVGASGADLDFSIVGAFDGASNVQDTGTAITATDWTEDDTDNIVLTVDVAALFDAGFYLPGRNFAILSDPDGITGDALVIGLLVRGFKV